MDLSSFEKSGRDFVTASELGREFNMSADYLTRLARNGRVEGYVSDKVWYLNRVSLSTYIQDQKLIQEERRRKLSQDRRAEFLRQRSSEVVVGGDSARVESASLFEQTQTFEMRATRAILVKAPHDLIGYSVDRKVIEVSTDSYVRFSAPVILGAVFLVFGSVYAMSPGVRHVAGEVAYHVAETYKSVNGTDNVRIGNGELNRGQLALSGSGDSLLGRVFDSLFGGFFSTTRGSVQVVISPRIESNVDTSAPPKPRVNTVARVDSNEPAKPEVRTVVPVIERTTERVVSDEFLLTFLLDKKLAALEDKLTRQLFSLSSTNANHITQVFQTASDLARIEHLHELNLTDPTISGGTITNTQITNASLSLSAPLAISSGGTGTSTAPTYGRVLIGNSLGGYDLMSTSSLGIIGAASSPGGVGGEIQFNSAGTFGGAADLVWDSSQSLLGVGTSSPYARLSVVGEVVAAKFTATTTATTTIPTLYLSGRFYDMSGSGGVSGSVLQSTGSGVQWVATSSLGIIGGGVGSSAFGQSFELIGGSLQPTTTVGILVSASSTIGNGLQSGGLTISGGATTTGNTVLQGSLFVSGPATLSNATTTSLAITGIT